WIEPLSADFAGATIWELPPSTQGIAVLQMLQLLDESGIERFDHNSADYLHWLIEAKKLVYEDRARYYADPERVAVPTTSLVARDYARRRAREIDPERASTAPVAGVVENPADTVYLTAVDEERNAVSLIQSIYRGFGSGNVPTGLGFALQNRGTLFSLDPSHPNRLEPRKRPFHTIIPGFVTVSGAPRFSFGVMGGDMQPQGQLQVLLNALLHGMDAQAAGDAPRFRHDGSSTPTGDRAAGSGTVLLESAVPEATARELRGRGHRVVRAGHGFGGYQGIWIESPGGLVGGTERRKDGCALGL
ncbi:MAG: gamma-glutamyltransferase, partial [Candidatus Bipolaricaulota bacterium]